jgi:hypothetical protein
MGSVIMGLELITRRLTSKFFMDSNLIQWGPFVKFRASRDWNAIALSSSKGNTLCEQLMLIRDTFSGLDVTSVLLAP